MRLETSAPSMTDVLLPDRMGRDGRLQRLDTVINWDRVDGLLSDVHSSLVPALRRSGLRGCHTGSFYDQPFPHGAWSSRSCA